MANAMTFDGPETGEKTAQYVHCEKCQHEWIAVWLPMEAGKAAKILKAASLCQMCGARATRMGKYPHATPQGDPVAWLAGGDTGTSSKTIWFVMMGRECTERYWSPNTPRDPADFGRCYRLLALMPSWRARLPEVAAKHPGWKPMIDAWDELTALYEEEVPLHTGMAPKLYARMQQLRDER
jgi:hypothetical protein